MLAPRQRQPIDASEEEEAVSSAVSTYLEEFGDPAELEDERGVPFSEILENDLGFIWRHVLVGSKVIREAVTFLDHFDTLVAELADDE